MLEGFRAKARVKPPIVVQPVDVVFTDPQALVLKSSMYVFELLSVVVLLVKDTLIVAALEPAGIVNLYQTS